MLEKMYEIKAEYQNYEKFNYLLDKSAVTGKFWKHWKYYIVRWSFKPEYHSN